MSVIDVAAQAVTATIAVGSTPLGIAIGPDDNRAYVTLGTTTVAVLDLTEGLLVGSVPIGGSLFGIAIGGPGG